MWKEKITQGSWLVNHASWLVGGGEKAKVKEAASGSHAVDWPTNAGDFMDMTNAKFIFTLQKFDKD